MRSSSATAGGSSARPNPAASRSARPRRPSTAAPQVTSAAAVPATVAMPHTAQRLGAGTESLGGVRSEEHTSELQSQSNLVCRLLLEKKKPALHQFASHAPPMFFLPRVVY